MNVYNAFTSLGTMLQTGQFNAAQISVNSDINNLGSAINTLSGYGIKTLLSDHVWNPSSDDEVSINKLSWGNYLKMEAEFSLNFDFETDGHGNYNCAHGNRIPTNFVQDDLSTDTSPVFCDSTNIVFRHDTGHVYFNTDDPGSNYYVWRCDANTNDQPGIALSNPRFRWRPNDVNAPLPRTMGFDLKFNREAITNNKLYLTIAAKFSGGTQSCNLATIKLKALALSATNDYPDDPGYKEYQYYNEEDPAKYIELNLVPVANAPYSTTISNPLAPNLPLDYWDNMLFEYEIDLDPLVQSTNAVMIANSDNYTFFHLYPEVTWCGNGVMDLDYITLEDDLHRSVRLIPDTDTSGYLYKLKERLQALENDNILYYYTSDEPPQGQFSMYRQILSYLESSGSKQLITPINLTDKWAVKTDTYPVVNNRYQHPINFLMRTKPRRIAVNPYPLIEFSGAEEDLIQWNNKSDNVQFIQNMLTHWLTIPYQKIAQMLKDPDYSDTELICVPQEFGEFTIDDEGNLDHWRFVMPPRSMAKCLQLMPLCYGADGIMSFVMATKESLYEIEGEDVYRLAPLMHNDDYSNLHVLPSSSAFDMIAAANSKISVYGPKIKTLNWVTADSIMVNGTHPEVDLNSLHLASLEVTNPDYINYNGYVQCGYYLDNNQLPSFMLVNRRAVYKNAPGMVESREVDNYFTDYPDQNVQFAIDSGAVSMFGSDAANVALYDPYEDALYKHIENSPNVIDVSIGPGDGKLLEMCGTSPDTVDSNISLRQKAVLSGAITICSSDTLCTEPNSEVRIVQNTQITLNPGAALILRGNVSISDNVHITIGEGAYVNMSEANCKYEGTTWISGSGSFAVADSTSTTYDANAQIVFSGGVHGSIAGTHHLSTISKLIFRDNSQVTMPNTRLVVSNYSNIQVHKSNLVLQSCNIMPKPGSTANGFKILSDSLSVLTIMGSSLENAPIEITNSDLFIQDCNFYIRDSTSAIKIYQTDTGHTLTVSGSNGSCGFFGKTTHLTKGIDILQSKSPLLLANAVFDSLEFGIRREANAETPDSIDNCTFTKCLTGISEISAKNCGQITNCNFTAIENRGLDLVGSIPTISNCVFDTCATGIFFENTIYSPKESGVYYSSFNNCSVAIESRSANPRLQNCSFQSNDTGLLCYKDSNLNLSNKAYNYFGNYQSNIEFNGGDNFLAYIQLLAGHNDFYHYNPLTCDFTFDQHYASSSGDAIDANYNWVEADSLIINDPKYYSYVKLESYDPEPNTLGSEPDGSNRYLVALNDESTGQYDQAVALYEAILNEQLVSEESYFNGCLDGLYRIKIDQDAQMPNLAQYIDQKINQYASTDSSFTFMLSNYLVKAYVSIGNFQSAIDMIQMRIDNPISEVDSLRAVLDLEIVLQLETLEEDKRPITTKYSQYMYNSIDAFVVNHEKHRELLRKLLEKEDTYSIPIPSVPVISSNYPNPFNPSTTIEFSVPQKAKVKMNVYNIRGQKVRNLINSELDRGHHKIVWDGRDGTNRNVSSGIYFVRLESDGKTNIRKVMLMK
jgi:hypothetical protein